MFNLTPSGYEPYVTIKQAASSLGLPYFKLQRAVKRGEIPSYRVLNSRALVRVSEVEAHIQKNRLGGAA